MEKKRFAVLAALEEDGKTRAGIESDDLSLGELQMLGFAAVSFIAESVIEKMPDEDAKRNYLTTLLMRITDIKNGIGE